MFHTFLSFLPVSDDDVSSHFTDSTEMSRNLPPSSSHHHVYQSNYILAHTVCILSFYKGWSISAPSKGLTLHCAQSLNSTCLPDFLCLQVSLFSYMTNYFLSTRLPYQHIKKSPSLKKHSHFFPKSSFDYFSCPLYRKSFWKSFL